MFQLGELITYGTHGVCRIIDRENRRVDRKAVEYFVLEPLDHPGSRFYVPTGNQAALSKLKRLLSAQELMDIVNSPESKADCWISDDNQRKQQYRSILAAGDRASVISLVRSLYAHKQRQFAAGKKFHMSDENFLNDAQKIIYSELSLVLEIPGNEVTQFLLRDG